MAELARSEDAIRRATTRATAVLAELEDDLRADTSWWDTSWVEQVIRAAPETFDRAFDRWRMLFRAALADQWEQNRRKQNYKLSEQQRIAGRRRAEAETQIALLRNEGSNDMNVSADFNPYRYLASEGFLPGYSFPRLPIAAYIPAAEASRAKATTCSGPGSWRSGSSAAGPHLPRGRPYEVHRVQLPPDAAGEVSHRGCAPLPRAAGITTPSRQATTAARCATSSSPRRSTGCLPLHTVFTRQRQRITSDEEERRRAGFRIVTSYRFQDHGDRPGRLDATAKDVDGKPVTRLTYGDSALVRRTNLGPTRRPAGQADGFWLDPVTGNWLSAAQASSARRQRERERSRRQPGQSAQAGHPVRAGQPEHPRPPARGPGRPRHRLSVMYALERGIEAAFQLEDVELDSELLPPDHGPRDRILFTESAEGGAGVLRRLQSEKKALREAALEALRIAHFHPETGEDLGGVPGHSVCEGLLQLPAQLQQPARPRADRPACGLVACCWPSAG